MFSKILGIDLGTTNTLIYLKNKGVLINEPSVVSVDSMTNEVVAVGNDAKNMLGKTPESIIAIKPLKNGVIANFDITINLIKYFLGKILRNKIFFKPKAIISIPSGITEVERRAVEDSCRQSGIGMVSLIEEPILSAIGEGLSVFEPTGNMIINIGGGTSEVAVISLGDIVTSCSSRSAGDKFNEAIISMVKKNHNLLIGEYTAENIKIRLGTAVKKEETAENEIEIKGRDIFDGLPKNAIINSEEVREALKNPIKNIIEAIKNTLEDTPPELSADIIVNGITLTGGSALLKGIDELISKETNMIVKTSEDPANSVINGISKCIDEYKSKYKFYK